MTYYRGKISDTFLDRLSSAYNVHIEGSTQEPWLDKDEMSVFLLG